MRSGSLFITLVSRHPGFDGVVSRKFCERSFWSARHYYMHIEPTPPVLERADALRKPSALSPNYGQLRADLSSRLSRVCGDMPPEAFDALVDEICAMKVRWAQSPTRGRVD